VFLLFFVDFPLVESKDYGPFINHHSLADDSKDIFMIATGSQQVVSEERAAQVVLFLS